MKKKKRLLLIPAAALIVVCLLKFFTGPLPEAMVPRSADCVALIDLKRIKSTIFWNFINTPAHRNNGEKKNGPDWSRLFELPDNLYVFHCSGRPSKAFYTVLRIKDETVFLKALDFYGFKKQDNNQYISKPAGIVIYRQGRDIIAGNADMPADLLDKVAAELFKKKDFITAETLSKLRSAQSHLAVYFAKGFISENEFIIKGNFDAEKITLSALIKPGKPYRFKDTVFSYTSGSLFSAGFTQPALAAILADSNYKSTISKAISLDTDSFFLPSNTGYQIDFTGMVSRRDSAITYVYDDDFNRVAKKTVNLIEEPSLQFKARSPVPGKIFSDLKTNGKLLKTGDGDLFTPFLLAKSYCSPVGDSALIIRSDHYKADPADQQITCILFFNIVFDKIRAGYLKYLPSRTNKITANLENIMFTAAASDSGVNVNVVIQKKKNNLPLFGN